MTTEEKIKAIEIACQKANPEIMEPRFGCRVKLKQNGNDGIILNEAYGIWLYYNYDAQQIFVRNFEKDEILGREIQLADVLLAIAKENLWMAIDELGRFMDWEGKHATYNLIKPIITWDLTKNLNGQKEEVVDFIFNLLQK
ncbi:MAG: hypothetical protein V4549_03630 [Bacteroidota bacterium]